MFGSYLGRAVRSSSSSALPARSTTNSSCLGATSTAASAVTGSRQLASSCSGQKHQRCYSSSKTSCPPDGSKSSQQNRSTTTTLAQQSADGEKRSGGRSGGRRKSRDPQQVTIKRGKDPDTFNLPLVPSTQHVEPTHINISSFFSQHRPISLTSAVPDPSSEASFGNIFDANSQRNRKQSDVVYTLSKAIETFDEASEVKAEKDFRWNMLQNSLPTDDSITHLDGAPRQVSLDQLITQFRPFNAPPKPVAFKKNLTNNGSSSRRGQTKLHEATQATSKPKRRMWSTTIIVSESTFSDGTIDFAVSNTPISRMSVPTENDTVTGEQQSDLASTSPTHDPRKARQPFLERMFDKEQLWHQYWKQRNTKKGEKMMLISVKRLRRLKMKKHKYKKLMRRQRNVRRKLERN